MSHISIFPSSKERYFNNVYESTRLNEKRSQNGSDYLTIGNPGSAGVREAVELSSPYWIPGLSWPGSRNNATQSRAFPSVRLSCLMRKNDIRRRELTLAGWLAWIPYLPRSRSSRIYRKLSLRNYATGYRINTRTSEM